MNRKMHSNYKRGDIDHTIVLNKVLHVCHDTFQTVFCRLPCRPNSTRLHNQDVFSKIRTNDERLLVRDYRTKK